MFLDSLWDELALYGLTASDRYVLGVSGGPDSICLLDLCVRSHLNITAVHVNHHLRRDADQDEWFVETTVKKYGIPFVSNKGLTPAFSAANGKSLEEKARRFRYEFLFAQARQTGSKAVLVAHNADDQVETVIMHLLRGAGIEGLAGMKLIAKPNEWDADVPLIRPLLKVARSEILGYCGEHSLGFVIDKTNQDESFFRNRIRNELIPLLETYNPQFKRLLLHTIDQMSQDAACLHSITHQDLREVGFLAGKNRNAIDREKFLQKPLGSQRRLIKYCLTDLLKEPRDIDFLTIQRAVEFCSLGRQGGMLELTQNVFLRRRDALLVFFQKGCEVPEDEYPQMDCSELRFPKGGKAICLNKYYCAHREHSSGLVFADRDINRRDQIFLDEEKIKGSLYFRKRNTGDRITPVSTSPFSLKISDLMINDRVPVPVRNHYPLLCDQEGIIWVPFLRLADRVKVTEASRKILRISIRKINQPE